MERLNENTLRVPVNARGRVPCSQHLVECSQARVSQLTQNATLGLYDFDLAVCANRRRFADDFSTSPFRFCPMFFV